MITAVRSRMSADKGFTLVELLVCIVLIGVLAGISVSVLLAQRNHSFDAGVKSDLRNASMSAETHYQEAREYSGRSEGYSERGDALPVASHQTFYTVYATNVPGHAGYVIVGASESGNTFALSSWSGKAPKHIDDWDTFATVGSPTLIELDSFAGEQDLNLPPLDLDWSTGDHWGELVSD